MKSTSIEDLIQIDLGLEKHDIKTLADEAEDNYWEVIINDHVVDIPSPALKVVQCWISDLLRAEYPIDEPQITAYEPGCSIVKNAEMHANNAHVLTLDIEDFFHSCSLEMVVGVLEEVRITEREGECRRKLFSEEIELLSKLACYKGSYASGHLALQL